MAEKAKGKLEVLKELYLCSCDGVSEEKALETLDKDNPEVMLRFIRQKCVEERATKGYEEELKEIRKAAALVRHEMQDMKEKMDVITEKVPSIPEVKRWCTGYRKFSYSYVKWYVLHL